eukprot:760866-Pelagomonas_calceolata.AAC.2
MPREGGNNATKFPRENASIDMEQCSFSFWERVMRKGVQHETPSLDPPAYSYLSQVAHIRAPHLAIVPCPHLNKSRIFSAMRRNEWEPQVASSQKRPAIRATRVPRKWT